MKIVIHEKEKIKPNEKLDPCPFCGGDGAMLIKYGGEYKIYCGNAECDAQFGWCDDKEHVIKSWNHRSNMVGNTKNKTREARWIINSDGYYPYCSACMAEPKNGEMADYCPNCGAKMKK